MIEPPMFRKRGGPSHAYMRMLRGQINAKQYAAILKRAVRIFGPKVMP